MSEPLATIPNPAGVGRPIISEEQYKAWLDDMAPFLKQGCTLWYAMERCALVSHERTIREKYKLNDWFSRKVDAYRATVGELINIVGVKTIQAIQNRLVETDGKVGILTANELQVWRTMAEKHRSAQQFFVTRVESSEADDTKLGKIIETMEHTDYDDVAGEAQKQMVATNAPLQNQRQTGATGDLPAQPDAVAPSS